MARNLDDSSPNSDDADLSPDDEDILEKVSTDLQTLGFTLNDSRIYVALLQIGLSSPAKIAEKSSVDRARVYDSLKRLVKRGIVEEEPVPRAPKYRAVPPERVFSKIRSRLQTKIDISEELENELMNLRKISHSETNAIWAIQGEQKIRNHFAEFLEEADEFAYLILTISDVTSQNIKELDEYVQKLIDKLYAEPEFKVSVALQVFPESREQKSLINQLFHAGADVYHWNAGGILPFGLYLTDHGYIQTYLSKLAPKPEYSDGIFIENANAEQIRGLKHMALWIYGHLCKKVVFKKKGTRSTDTDEEDN